jgi:hypothetical protein
MQNALVTLYRGIAVVESLADNVKENILQNGIGGDEGNWKIQQHDLRDTMALLYDKLDLSIRDTRPSSTGFAVVCACGDLLGASYYAIEHNKIKTENKTSIIIEFTAPMKDIFIDGKDFLYTCFQFWDKQNASHIDEQTELLSTIYGTNIKKYFNKVIASDDTYYRIAMCDLACQDFDVLLGHLKNKAVIGGRYRTTFCSAFNVRLPISQHNIIGVYEAKPNTFSPKITLDSFLKGSTLGLLGMARRGTITQSHE